jgi:hypothetical protein
MLNPFSFLKNLFRGKACGCNTSSPAEIFLGLRRNVLTLDPTTVGITANEDNPVWGFVMDMGRDNGCATLVAIADGTVSMYFSGGGGVIGLGEQEGPRNAAHALLTAAKDYLVHFSPAKEFALPKNNMVNMFLLTNGGVLAAAELENNLGYYRSPISPLFHAAHALITQIRLVDEKMRGK